MQKTHLIYLLVLIMAFAKVGAQDENPFATYNVPSQNLLKFNRFLINPTFSTVREDKSYLNLLHRNQAATFDDNSQAYFLSHSGRINDRTGLGISLYTQQESLISNYGVLANYAYGIKLSDKSNFTFGANITYYNSGFNKYKANPSKDDPLLNGFQNSSLLSFQPGFNLSYGKFDFGGFAENLFDYNLSTTESITEFKDKTFSGHLQYTHQLKSDGGILEEARLMPLARVRKVGEEDIILGGNLILDLPKLGWLQAGYDTFYGASAGIGFNLNKRLSLGYTMEKGLSSNFNNFGITHEISFAYSFSPNLTEDRVMLEDDKDKKLVSNEKIDLESLLNTNKKIEKLKKALVENDVVLDELIFRQDSLEANRKKDLERRFEMLVRTVRNENNGNFTGLGEKAKKKYFINNDKSEKSTRLAENDNPTPIYKDNTQRKTDSRVTDHDKIKTRKFKNLEGVTNGYYAIANVYKGEQYLYSFMDKLNAQGIETDYIDNPNNGLKYVYLERYDTWQEAVYAHRSKINGTYNDDLWIMNVNNSGYTDKAYVNNSSRLKEKASKYEIDVLKKNLVPKDRVATNETKSKTLSEVDPGFYIIASVFANPKNADRFLKLLNADGFNASYFINPKNNYRYVYLKKHSNWDKALIYYYSKRSDSHYEKIWIMRVTKNSLT